MMNREQSNIALGTVLVFPDEKPELYYGHPLMNKLIEAMQLYADQEYSKSEWSIQAEYVLDDNDLPTTEHNIRTLVGWIL